MGSNSNGFGRVATLLIWIKTPKKAQVNQNVALTPDASRIPMSDSGECGNTHNRKGTCTVKCTHMIGNTTCKHEVRRIVTHNLSPMDGTFRGLSPVGLRIHTGGMLGAGMNTLRMRARRFASQSGASLLATAFLPRNAFDTMLCHPGKCC